MINITFKSVHGTLQDKEFLFANACESLQNNGSLHVHVPSLHFNTIAEQQRFFNAVKLVLDTEVNDWFFIDETKKSYIMKTFIDFGVYNKNR